MVCLHIDGGWNFCLTVRRYSRYAGTLGKSKKGDKEEFNNIYIIIYIIDKYKREGIVWKLKMQMYRRTASTVYRQGNFILQYRPTFTYI